MPPTSKNIKNILNNCTNNKLSSSREGHFEENFMLYKWKVIKIRRGIAHTKTWLKPKSVNEEPKLSSHIDFMEINPNKLCP